MKALLVYPVIPETFWSFKHILKFIRKKAAHVPLGMLTVAAMLPKDWEIRAIDMNVEILTDSAIKWADTVFISAMIIQKESVRQVIDRCKALGTPITVGGPLFTSSPQDYDDVDHMVLDEGELTLPPFLEDLAAGKPQHMYRATERPDITTTPLPRWDPHRHQELRGHVRAIFQGMPVRLRVLRHREAQRP